MNSLFSYGRFFQEIDSFINFDQKDKVHKYVFGFNKPHLRGNSDTTTH